jgi:hypothetical protein
MNNNTPYSDVEALQARLAARVVAGLGERAAALPHDIGERLRVARDQAILRAREIRLQAPVAAPALAGVAGGAIRLGGPSPWWQRMASALPLLVLLAGLLLIDQWNLREQMLAAADIDAVLLADDLPPTAYSDPGFGEFLRSPQP